MYKTETTDTSTTSTGFAAIKDFYTNNKDVQSLLGSDIMRRVVAALTDEDEYTLTVLIGDDWNIIAMANMLGYSLNNLPSYVESFAFELWTKADGSEVVKTRYNFNTIALGGACLSATECTKANFMSMIEGLELTSEPAELCKESA